ncbi:hypothetical protein [Polaromonas sp.]|jgi:hypothetical protein|uniref:hypothetical protein n=1 Tax=Polaromonas sp. TaxID=1869339 RepID=UPI0037C98586
MQAHLTSCHIRPTVALADYDFLRATYDMLLRAPVPDWRAINAAFAALDAAHARLKAAHLQQAFGLLHQDSSAGDPSIAEDPPPAH